MLPQRPAILLFLCFFFAFPGLGWREPGHRALARLAAAHLSPAARSRVAALLRVKDAPDSVSDGMAEASVWADNIKAQNHTGQWHFINIAVQDARSDMPSRCASGNCITDRIDIFRRQLASHRTLSPDDLDALRYVIHLVGDVQQPLHTTSDADMGGNCEQVNSLQQARNLHDLWDGSIVRAINPSDARLAESLNAYIGGLDPRNTTDWSNGNANDWAWESHQIAVRVVYQRLHIPLEPVGFPRNCAEAPLQIQIFRPAVDSLYINDMKPIVRDQLAKGGLRLAALLNSAFD